MTSLLGQVGFCGVLLFAMMLVVVSVTTEPNPDSGLLFTTLPIVVALITVGAVDRPKNPPKHGDDEGGDTT